MPKIILSLFAALVLAAPAAALMPLGTSADPVITQAVPGTRAVVSVSSNVSVAGYNAIAPQAGASLAYVVLAYNVSCTNVGTVGFAFAQTDNKLADLITSTKTVSSGGDINVDLNPFGVFKSSAGASLGINLNNAGPCGVDLTYTTQ